MTPNVPGIHHVTAISSDPSTTAEFYAERLGLRMVKRTVNHDSPGTYHLYFADGRGTPGTSITFFPWGTGGRRGSVGAGQVTATTFNAPPGSLSDWAERLADLNPTREERFGRPVLGFDDPDGIRIELVEGEEAPEGFEPWPDSPVAPATQLRGFHGVTLSLSDAAETERVLEDVLGYGRSGEADGRVRFEAAGDGAGSVVDLVEADGPGGTTGVGTVHHVAFRAGDESRQAEVREALLSAGLDPTEPIDRVYFRSVYAREPGGVLFEFATEGPGFTADQPVEELGEGLTLPPWLEDDRAEIEAALPSFEPPAVATGDVGS